MTAPELKHATCEQAVFDAAMANYRRSRNELLDAMAEAAKAFWPWTILCLQRKADRLEAINETDFQRLMKL